METIKINIRTLLLVSLLLFAAGTSIHAASKEKKTVRVGWFDSTFNQMDNAGERSGFAYEYERSIAAITGWKYEYVEDTWPNLFEKLQRGDIDLLADVTLLPERKRAMLFSLFEMGKESSYLITLKHHKTIRLGHPETFNGTRIGVNKNSFQVELLHQWLKVHNVKAKVIETNFTRKEYFEHLKDGDLDAVAIDHSHTYLTDEALMPFTEIGSNSVYFAINKNRPDLKVELDEAMDKINTYNPYYPRDLHIKYFLKDKVRCYLTYDEEKWVRQHGTIRIGFRDSYMPFCAMNPETGEVTGLLNDFIEKVNSTMTSYGVHVEAVPYDTYPDAIKALKRGEVDVAFPNGMSLSHAEKEGLTVSDPFIKSTEFAIVRKDYKFAENNHLRMAVNDANINLLSTIKEQYPGWDVVFFDDFDACLEGIADNKADVIIVSNYRMSIIYNKLERLKLRPAATGHIITHSFALNEDDLELVSVMNRLSHILPDEEVSASLTRFSTSQQESSISDFVHEHITTVLIGLILIITLFAILLFIVYKENRKARSASAAKTRFLFNMSHDIRTPMNAIMGYSELLEQDASISGKSREQLSKIRVSGQFLLDLINNVLEMSRIESGKTELTEQPHLISELLQEVTTVYDDLMKKKGINFSCHIDAETKAIYCDRMKVTEIFLNLVSNAYKYTANGGSVRVLLEELPDTKPGFTTLRFQITDTGAGMSKEYLPHVFEDFTRERSFTDNKIFGTGLGMSIVKHLVDLMHGTVSVESELRKGSTFTVTLPLRIADESSLTNTADEEFHSFNGENILLVEDNELNADIATEILTDEGFIVSWAKNGQEAVDMVTQAKPGTYDIILMDVQMPVMNGYDATRAIRRLSDPDKASIPIIAMTANAFEEDRKDAESAGMNGHIAKPIDVPLLLHTIADNLKGV